MTLQDETTLFPDPEPSDDAPETPRLRDRVREALERESTEDLVTLLDPLPNSEAGPTAFEHALLCDLVAVVLVGAMALTGSSVGTLFSIAHLSIRSTVKSAWSR